MGAGKTTVGRDLAALLGWDLLDNDALLRRETGSSLNELAARGESVLHDSESVQMREAAEREPPFVAGVAASVADRPADLKLLRGSGVVVYLRVRAETLAARLGDGQGRPWLDDDPVRWIKETLAGRDDAYAGAADVIIDVDDLTADEVARRLKPAVLAAAVSWERRHQLP